MEISTYKVGFVRGMAREIARAHTWAASVAEITTILCDEQHGRPVVEIMAAYVADPNQSAITRDAVAATIEDAYHVLDMGCTYARWTDNHTHVLREWARVTCEWFDATAAR